MKWRIPACFLVVGGLWGSAWMFSSLLPGPPLLAGAVRFAIAAALLLAIAAAALAHKRHESRKTLHSFPFAPSILLGVTLTGLPYALAVWAKDFVSAGVMAVLYAAMPLAALFFGRKGSNRASLIPAMAIGMGGIAFVVARGIDYSARQIWGALLLGAAVGLGAFSLNYAKEHIQRGQILLSSAIQCTVSAVLLMFLSGTGGWPSPVQWTRSSVAMLAALAAVEGAVALPLFFWLLTKMEAWQAATLQWLATLVAVAEAGWFLREKPTWQMSAGAAMAAGAMLWLMRPGRGADDQSDAVTLQITSPNERAFQPSDFKQG
jgi:drug/metabolite transporter (DMT)-like permease